MAIELVEKIPSPYKITLTRRTGVSPNIYYYFRLKGKDYRRSTKTDDPKEAHKIALRIYHEIESGKAKSKKINFDGAAKRFLAYKKPRITPETYLDYVYRSRILCEFFKNKDITTFIRNDFNDYKVWRLDYHKNKGGGNKVKQIFSVGDTTINRDIGLLISILIFENDEFNLNIPIPKWQKLPERKRTELLSADEIDKLKQYWLTKNFFYWDIMSFILSIGLRYPSEITNLKWKNIDKDFKYMSIKRKSRLKDKIKNWPVKIYDEAHAILTRLKNRNVPTGQEDYVFVDSKGRRIGNIKKAFKASLKACGIDKNFPMFSFRHQFATEMIARGMPAKALSEQMGHKSIRMVDETYTHLEREHHNIIAERIGLTKKATAEDVYQFDTSLYDFKEELTDEDWELLARVGFNNFTEYIEANKKRRASNLPELSIDEYLSNKVNL